MVSLNTVVQDSDDHISARVASLPGREDVHFRSTAVVFITTVLEDKIMDDHLHSQCMKTDICPYPNIYYFCDLATQSVCMEICHRWHKAVN